MVGMAEQLIARRVLAVQRTLHPFYETVLQAPARGWPTMVADWTFRALLAKQGVAVLPG